MSRHRHYSLSGISVFAGSYRGLGLLLMVLLLLTLPTARAAITQTVVSAQV